jgi:hypothetical protein
MSTPTTQPWLGALRRFWTVVVELPDWYSAIGSVSSFSVMKIDDLDPLSGFTTRTLSAEN